MGDERKEFLIHMYDQLFNDINRHIMVIWQSIVVLTGAIAALILQGKNIIPLGISTTIIIVIASWLIAHAFDSSYWYNRNLVIIANIERQFLTDEDLKLIHYYFGKHRPKNKMISHLRLQFYLAVGIGIISIIYQFYSEYLEGFKNCLFVLPIIALIIAFFLLYNFKKGCDSRYEEFINNSPGKEIKTDSVKYDVGHGGT